MHALIVLISKWMAYLGGMMLACLILLTCVSVLGRSLNGMFHDMTIAPALGQWLLDAGVGGINGDYELIEMGVAFAIFAFLPICQLSGSHASVDIFTSRFPVRVNRVLSAITAIVFAAVMVLIAVQLCSGMLSKFRTGQTTFLLAIPVWWAYAFCLVGAGLAAVVAVYVAVIRVAEWLTGRDLVSAMSENSA